MDSSDSSNTSALATGGNYYLASDIQTTSTITIGNTVNLSLNGYVIDAQSTSGVSVITVSSGATLNLYGNGETIGYGTGVGTTYTYDLNNTNAENEDYTAITGGLITGGTGTPVGTSNVGGGVYVMYTSSDSYGTFNMYGGNIAGNTVTSIGGGVYVQQYAQFTMSGGSITGNTASKLGGGVYENQNATFTMTGGEISGNTATSGGGGVYVAAYSSTFNMSGGVISGNTSQSSDVYGSGGVYVAGTFNISGSPVISDNTNNEVANNVYLWSGNTITVAGELTEGANIGVTTYSTPSDGSTVTFVSGADSADYAQYFSSDAGHVVKTGANTTDGYDYNLAVNKVEATFTYTAYSEYGTAGATGAINIYTNGSATYTPSGSSEAYDLTSYQEEFASSIDANLESLLGEWTVLTADNTSTVATGGNFYLAGDIKTTSTITIGGTVNLSLNGYVIDAGYDEYNNTGGASDEKKFSVITVSSGATLNLYDAEITDESKETEIDDLTDSGDAKITIKGGLITGGNTTYGGGVNVKGTFNMYGGSIAGNTATFGGGVYVYDASNSSIFTMTGGAVTGNTAANGGGVYLNVKGELMLSGTAEISGNKASSDGGGVYLNSSGALNMSGGTISSNTALYIGGGVYMGGTSSTFKMTGGEISGNTATSGGGVYDYGTFNMSGGTISGNTATSTTSYGGGVYVKGTFNVSGAPVISGNAKGGTISAGSPDGYTVSGGTTNNVYLYSEKYITINGALDENSSIGVTMANGTGDFTNVYSADYSEYFTADDSSSYRVVATESGENYTLSLADLVSVDTSSRVIYANGMEMLIADGGVTGETKIYFGYDGDGDYTDSSNYQYTFSDSNFTISSDTSKAVGIGLSAYTIYGGSSADYTGDTRVTITGGTITSAFSGNADGSEVGNANLDINLSTNLTISGVLGTSTVGEGVTSFATKLTDDDEDAYYVVNYSASAKTTVAYFAYDVTTIKTSSFVNTAENATESDYDLSDYSLISEAGVEPVAAVYDDNEPAELITEAVAEANGFLIFAIDSSKINVAVEDGETDDNNASTTYTGSDINVTTTETVYFKSNGTTYDDESDGDDVTGSFGISTSWTDSNGGTTMQNAGSYTKTVTATTDGEFYGTTSATYTVNQMTVTVAWSDGSYTYTGSKLTAPTATYTNASSESVDLVVAEDDSKTFQNAGDYGFTASFADSDTDSANYTLSGETETFSITKATPTVTAPTAVSGLVYSGTAKSLISAGSTIGGELQYALDDSEYSTSIPTATNAGTYTVYYKVVGDDNYNSVETANFEVTISAYDITTGYTIGDFDTLTYTGVAQTPSATVTVTALSETATGSWSQVTNVADKTTFTANGNFTGTITDEETGMAKASITATVTTPEAITYGDSVPTYAITYSGFVNNESPDPTTAVTFTCSYAQGSNAGEYDITASGAEFANYDVASYTFAKLTVGKLEAVIAWTAPSSLVYSGSEILATAAVSNKYNSDDEVTVGVSVAEGSASNGTNVGVVTYVASISNENTNYKLETSTTQDYTITAKPVTFTWTENPDLTYSGVSQGSEISATVVGGVDGDTFTLTYDAVDGDDVNVDATGFTKTVTALGNDNYMIDSETDTETSGVYKITPKTIEIDWKDNETSYVYTDSALTAPTATYTDINGSKIELTVSAGEDVTFKDVDKYTFTASFKNSETNYALPSSVTKEISITAATNEIKDLAIADWTYGETASTPSATATFGKIVYTYESTDDTTYTSSETAPTNAGTYKVIATVVADGSNYAEVTASEEFTIAKAQLTAPTADSTDYTYNGGEQTYTLVTDDNYTITGNVQENADTYTVKVAINDTDNYEWKDATVGEEIADLEYTFTIAKALLTAPTADSKDYTYNGYEQTYALVTDDNYTITGNVQEDADTYTVKVAINDTDNYEWKDATVGEEISDLEYTFTIAKAEFTVSEVVFANKTYLESTADEKTVWSVAVSSYDEDGLYGDEEISITYDNNGKTDAGVYSVYATFSAGDNYEDIAWGTPATLTIVKAYTVTFNSNGGSVVSSQTVYNGYYATRPTDPTKSGSKFVGWYTEVTTDVDGVETTYEPFSFATAITGDTTIYAVWNVVTTYTVTFNSNGGSDVADIENIAEGSTITKPADPTYEGYVFGGWSLTEGGKTAISFATTKITDDTTLYAIWTAIEAVPTYTVTFNSNGGTDVTAVTGITSGNSITAMPTAPTKDGYTFIAWYKDSALLSVFNSSSAITADTTLYAKWAQETYEISGNVKDGNGDVITSDCTATLKIGNVEYQTAEIDANGNFTFTKVPAGTYNLVLEYGSGTETQTITSQITIVDDNVTGNTYEFSNLHLNSKLNVAGDVTDVVVSGLDSLFDDAKAYNETDEALATAGASVEIVLNVTQQADGESEDEASIASEAGDSAVGLIFDITLTKTVTDGSTTLESTISEIDDPLGIEIILPEELRGMETYSIVRVHDGVSETLTTTANDNGEYFVVNSDKTIITIYGAKYSTYAIAYTEAVSVTTSTSSSSSVALDVSAPSIDAEGTVLTIQDDNLIAVYVNGEKYQAEENTFVIDLASFGNGEYEIVAWDRYGRTTTQVFTVSGSDIESGEQVESETEETPVVTETPSATTSPQTSEGESTSSFPWWILAVAIVVVGGVCGYIVYKKKK